jgi:hypothetical protein
MRREIDRDLDQSPRSFTWLGRMSRLLVVEHGLQIAHVERLPAGSAEQKMIVLPPNGFADPHPNEASRFLERLARIHAQTARSPGGSSAQLTCR